MPTHDFQPSYPSKLQAPQKRLWLFIAIIAASIFMLSLGVISTALQEHRSNVQNKLSDNALIIPGIAYQLSREIDITPKDVNENDAPLPLSTIAQNQLASHVTSMMLADGTSL